MLRSPVLRALISTITLVLAVASLSAPAAHADDGAAADTVTGGDVSPAGTKVPAAVAAQASDKATVAHTYALAKQGRADVEDFKAAEAAYEASWPASTPRRADEAALSRAGTDDLAMALAAGDRVLSVAHYGQQKNYYCGPASGKMVLKYLNEGASAYNGNTQNQTNIANSAHMRTDINGKTGWSTGLFRIGINRWRQGTNTGYYIDTADPSGTYFKDALLYDIDRGMPFGANTVEFYNGAHYNGHPNRVDPIGHWIVAHGYYSYGASARFADPSTTVWSGVAPHFTRASLAFADTFLNSNGITW